MTDSHYKMIKRLSQELGYNLAINHNDELHRTIEIHSTPRRTALIELTIDEAHDQDLLDAKLEQAFVALAVQ